MDLHPIVQCVLNTLVQNNNSYTLTSKDIDDVQIKIKECNNLFHLTQIFLDFTNLAYYLEVKMKYPIVSQDIFHIANSMIPRLRANAVFTESFQTLSDKNKKDFSKILGQENSSFNYSSSQDDISSKNSLKLEDLIGKNTIHKA